MGIPAEDDDRDPSTVKLDLLVDQVNALCASMAAAMESRGSNTQTVIHKTAGMGPWGAAAVTACFCTLIGLVLLSIYIIHTDGLRNDDIRDLKAWQQIHEKRLNQLERKP